MAVVELADDGFVRRRELAARFPSSGERNLVKASGHLARQGLLLERRGTDGAVYLALTGEGWRTLGGERAPGSTQLADG
jgi:hypothetical protein